ncbi:hypothetical protein KAU32_01175 [bacterium]|nr:hypothetical protein [bacterium]
MKEVKHRPLILSLLFFAFPVFLFAFPNSIDVPIPSSDEPFVHFRFSNNTTEHGTYSWRLRLKAGGHPLYIYPSSASEINILIGKELRESGFVVEHIDGSEIGWEVLEDTPSIPPDFKLLDGILLRFRETAATLSKGKLKNFYISERTDQNTVFNFSRNDDPLFYLFADGITIKLPNEFDADAYTLSYIGKEGMKIRPNRYNIFNGKEKHWRILFLDPTIFTAADEIIYYADSAGLKKYNKMKPYFGKGLSVLNNWGFTDLSDYRLLLFDKKTYKEGLLVINMDSGSVPVTWVSSVLLKVFGFSSGGVASYTSLINIVSQEVKELGDIPYFIQSGIQVILLDILFEAVMGKENKFMKFKDNSDYHGKILDIRDWGPPPPGYTGEDPDPDREAYFWASYLFWHRFLTDQGEQGVIELMKGLRDNNAEPFTLLGFDEASYLIDYSKIKEGLVL